MNLQRMLMMVARPLLNKLIKQGISRFAGPPKAGPKTGASMGAAANRLRQSLRMGRKLW